MLARRHRPHKAPPPPVQHEVDLYDATERKGRLRHTAAWGCLEVEVAADRMSARLVRFDRLPQRRPAPGDIANSLNRMGLVFGLQRHALRSLAKGLPRGAQQGLLLARGTAPRPPLDWVQRHTPTPEDFAALHALCTSPRVPDLAAGVPTVVTVRPDDPIAYWTPPQSRACGRDVFGHPMAPSPQPQNGSFVAYCPRQRLFMAEIFGYVLLAGGVLSILPPLWISPDRLQALYIGLPTATGTLPPNRPQLYESLRQAHVLRGIRTVAVDAVCHSSNKGKGPFKIPIACGRKAVSGTDGRLVPRIRPDLHPGRLRSDGSIDLRERGRVRWVRRGDLLALGHSPTPGRPGFTIEGRELPAGAGAAVELELGEGVLAVEGSQTRYYAARDGALYWKSACLDVRPLVVIEGDIDYATGHVRTPHDLLVKGSIQSGFLARAGGHIWISGGVCPGARVQSGGDMVVGQGIVGTQTRLQAGGSLQAPYIHRSRVATGRDLDILSHISHALVVCGGTVRVIGGGTRPGSIVGGRVCATQGIQARSAGSKATPATALHIIPPLALQKRIDALYTLLNGCGPAPALIEQANLSLKRLLSQRDRLLAQGEIRISRRVFGRTTLAIGEKSLHIDQTGSGGSARLVNGKTHLRRLAGLR